MLFVMAALLGLSASSVTGGPGMIVQGPYDGRFEQVVTPQQFDEHWKAAQTYCVKAGRHATIVMNDVPGHAFAFHCYRNLNIVQMWLGDDGR